MGGQPDWFDESIRNGILIVGIYFKIIKDYVQNEARRWLGTSLCNNLKGLADSIEPLEYALTRYISYTKRKGMAGKAKGGEYKYLVKNATPEFYERLFKILEEKRKSGKPEWFGDYYVLFSKRLLKEVVVNEE